MGLPNASVTSNHGPRTIFYHPYDFLPVRPSEAPVGILRRCCSRGHIRLGAPYGLDTAVYWWFGWIIRMTPRVPRAVPVRASYGPRTGIFNVFHILLDPYGARAGPARVPYGALTDTQGNWHNQNWQKSRTGVVFCSTGPYGPRTGPARAVHGLFKISKPVRGP